MPFYKNDPNINKKGRGKGVLNKDTQGVKDAFRRLLEDNVENMSKWLAQIAETNPSKAIDLVFSMREYLEPKLSRTEVVGNEGEDLFKGIKFTFNTATKKDDK